MPAHQPLGSLVCVQTFNREELRRKLSRNQFLIQSYFFRDTHFSEILLNLIAKFNFTANFQINTLNYLRRFCYKQRKIVILIPELFIKKQKLDSF